MLDDWQRLVLDVGMGERVDGRWAASDVDEIASRQNGKNGTVEVRELYGAVILGEWIIHTAHLFSTTKESYSKLLTLIEANPDVKDQVTWQVASPASGYEMRFRSGGRVKFIARSRMSGRGLTGDVLVFDEAQDLDDDAVGALLPTISSRPNPQTWYLGSAPGPQSVVWHRRRRAGRSGEHKRRAYFEFSADPDCDLDDRDAWAQANPGLGLRLTEEAIEAERAAMSEEMFARERLSVSPDIDPDNPETVLPLDKWAACADEYSTVPGRVVFAFDASPDRSSASVAVGGWRADGLPHVAVVRVDAGTGWVVDEIAALVAEHQPGWVVCDPAGPAGSLIQTLEAKGVEVRQVTTREHAQACGTFFDDTIETRLRHRGQRELTAAVEGADRRTVGDAWLWARQTSSADISPLVAATLARWAVDLPVEEEILW